MTQTRPEHPEPVADAGRVQQVASLFDEVAPSYDTVGVDFFRPIAAGLVAALAPGPGERVLDLGCGKGAFLLPAARAVGPQGSAMGVDASTDMVEAARASVAAEGLAHASVRQGDAQAPDLPEASFDVLAASLVLFFLPHPIEALTAWRALLAPGGRMGVSTFGPQDDVWASVDEVFTPYLSPAMLDARTSGRSGPFTSDDGMEQLVRQAGFSHVRTTTATVQVRFADAEHWRAFTMTTGQRAMWRRIPERERPAVQAEAQHRLARAVQPDGGYVLHQQVRYTLGTRPA